MSRTSAFAIAILLSACTTATPERGPGAGGKADDGSGTCRKSDGTELCGGHGSGNCWCDSECSMYGDCCGDYEAICEGGGGGGTGNKLDYKSYDVVFTNPLCNEYQYQTPIATADGTGQRTSKPRNVYCKSSQDYGPSADRPGYPQQRMLDWIKSTNMGDEIFLAFLSFSNRGIETALCDAAHRGAKVTFVLDGPTPLSDHLKTCGASILIRGHHGDIGFAHNKIIMINPNGPGPSDGDSKYMRLVFGSGNMSSGPVLHHDNWHFIEVNRDSYFAKAHQCLVQAQLSESATASRQAYSDALKTCRDAISNPMEDDAKIYFVPAFDDSTQAEAAMLDNVDGAASIDIATHRFGHPGLVDHLVDRFSSNPDFTVRMIGDDDLYWLRPLTGNGHQVGDNQQFEASNVRTLENAGKERYEIRFLETNHAEHLLHHSKYLLYRNASGEPTGVLCGAANLTDTGFNENFENIYYITIPSVLAEYDTQFKRYWDGEKAPGDTQDPPIATPKGRMPAQDVAP